MTQKISYKDVSETFAEGLMKTESYLKDSSLDKKLMELMKYRISQINRCAYCLDMHHRAAIEMGETEQRLHSLSAWRDSPFYSGEERAVLAYAEILTTLQDDDTVTFERLSSFFTKSQIADIILAVTQINTWNRINKSFGIIPATIKRAGVVS